MKRAVVLMNLGSPDSTRVPDVRKYLNEFLMDERVIDMPYLLRLLLVKGIIVPFRAPKSAKAYASIWTKEGSPLIVISKELQAALQEKITEPVSLAMRYGSPSPKEAFDSLLAENPDLEEVLAIPLYPHYAMSSFETAALYASEIHKKYKYPFRLTQLKPFYNKENYIQALAARIKPYLSEEFDHILFSFHGIPERHVRKTDITGTHCLQTADCCSVASPAHDFCYRHQIIETTRLAAEALGLPKDKFSFSFQSRLGRDPWLKPYTVTQLAEFPGKGIKKLLIVCPAFVSDCLETLEEIAEEGRDIFLEAGGTNFTMIPCLNTHPLWVETLADWIRDGQDKAKN